MNNNSTALAEKVKGLDAKKIGNALLNNALIIIMLAVAVYVAVTEPSFLAPRSLVNLLSLTAAYLPVALGIAGCIVLTGTDLSAGRAVGITACVAASLLQAADAPNKMWPAIGTLPVPLVILIVVALGAAIGAFNGFFVAKFKLHPFIVTLATQLILYTMLLLYVKMGNNNGMAISGLGHLRPGRGLPQLRGGQPAPSELCRRRHPDPQLRHLRHPAERSDVVHLEQDHLRQEHVRPGRQRRGRPRFRRYGWAGFVESARVASNTANTGVNYELDAIAACVIGGVSFVGGIGKVSGIIIGVIMLRLIFVALPLVGMDQNLQYAIKGGIILFACALDMRKYLVKK